MNTRLLMVDSAIETAALIASQAPPDIEAVAAAPGAGPERQPLAALNAEAVAACARAVRARGVWTQDPAAVEAVIGAAARLHLPHLDSSGGRYGLPAIGPRLHALGVPFAKVCLAGDAASAAEAIMTLDAGAWMRTSEAVRRSCWGMVNSPQDSGFFFSHVTKRAPGLPVWIQQPVSGEVYYVPGFQVGRDFHPLEVFHAVFRPGMYRLPAYCVMPSGLGGEAYTAIVARARLTGRAVPAGTGPMVLEFVMSTQGPVLTGLDVAPGVEPVSALLLRHALGLDYLGDALRIAAGASPRSMATRDMGAAIAWHAPHAGVVEQVSGLDAARAMPGVQAVHMGLREGETIGHIIDAQARDHAGYVLATGPNDAMALARAAAALETVRITTRAARV